MTRTIGLKRKLLKQVVQRNKYHKEVRQVVELEIQLEAECNK